MQSDSSECVALFCFDIHRLSVTMIDVGRWITVDTSWSASAARRWRRG